MLYIFFQYGSYEKNSKIYGCEEKAGVWKGACSGAADAMGGERLDMPAMGVMEKAAPARHLQQQGNDKSQLVGWERDAI